MDKSSTTLLFLLLLSSSLVLTLFIATAVFLSKQPQLQFIWLFSSSHPLLALNLLILLIIVSSRCFAVSRHNGTGDRRGELLLLDDATQGIVPVCPGGEAADGIAEAPTSMSKKEGTIERTWKKTKEGSQLRQLKHSHSTTEDIIRPRETLTEPSSEEVTSSGSSSLSSAKLRKEVSLTREEVTRRVERFIRKFNDD